MGQKLHRVLMSEVPSFAINGRRASQPYALRVPLSAIGLALPAPGGLNYRTAPNSYDTFPARHARTVRIEATLISTTSPLGLTPEIGKINNTRHTEWARLPVSVTDWF